MKQEIGVDAGRQEATMTTISSIRRFCADRHKQLACRETR